MSMITGVGDEVVEAVCVLLVVSVAALAWWSTAARPDRFRTVIVMERTARAPHNIARISRNFSIMRRQLLRGSASAPTPSIEPAPSSSEEEVAGAGGGAEAARAGGAELAGSAQAQEMDRIVDAMDADINALRHRRLNFFTRGESTSESTLGTSSPNPFSTHSDIDTNKTNQPLEAEGDSNADKTSNECQTDNGEPETNVRNETEETTCKLSSEAESSEPSTENAGSSDESTHKVNIRLKYLNDTFREVDGSMEELLKDFKSRHFATELSGDYRVLLIFNGHVLSEETSTLRSCGLYHNCVVHCLVHPPRQRGAGAATGEVVPSLLETAGLGSAAGGIAHGAEAEAAAAAPAEGRAWDLENVLMTLVSIILTIIWFFRCEYSNIFTASASGALFALTVFYSVAIFGLYFSDTFHFAERRPRDDAAGVRHVPYT